MCMNATRTDASVHEHKMHSSQVSRIYYYISLYALAKVPEALDLKLLRKQQGRTIYGLS